MLAHDVSADGNKEGAKLSLVQEVSSLVILSSGSLLCFLGTSGLGAAQVLRESKCSGDCWLGFTELQVWEVDVAHTGLGLGKRDTTVAVEIKVPPELPSCLDFHLICLARRELLNQFLPESFRSRIPLIIWNNWRYPLGLDHLHMHLLCHHCCFLFNFKNEWIQLALAKHDVLDLLSSLYQSSTFTRKESVHLGDQLLSCIVLVHLIGDPAHEFNKLQESKCLSCISKLLALLEAHEDVDCWRLAVCCELCFRYHFCIDHQLLDLLQRYLPLCGVARVFRTFSF